MIKKSDLDIMYAVIELTERLSNCAKPYNDYGNTLHGKRLALLWLLKDDNGAIA